MIVRFAHHDLGRKAVILAALLIAASAAACRHGDDDDEWAYVPGQSYFGTNGYVEYIAGDLPVVLTAPHGGSLRPDGIPDRAIADTVQDYKTLELALVTDSVIMAAHGHRPHVVLCRLHRVKLDCNRDSVTASQGNAEAGLAWHEFHAFIETATARILAQHERGLLVDLHGHAHPIQRLELGYELTGDQLDLADNVIDQGTWLDSTSVRYLQLRSGASLSDLLRGPTAFGTLLAARGYPSVPSATDHGPAGAPYFSGGYNTQRYGSKHGGTISALQLEIYLGGILDTPDNRRAFGVALSQVLATYLATYLDL